MRTLLRTRAIYFILQETDWSCAIFWATHCGQLLSHLHVEFPRSYIFWTISDNWEWADGFCPKFGLAAVDRSKPDLPRVIRKESFDLFKQIVETREVRAAASSCAILHFVCDHNRRGERSRRSRRRLSMLDT